MDDPRLRIYVQVMFLFCKGTTERLDTYLVALFSLSYSPSRYDLASTINCCLVERYLYRFLRFYLTFVFGDFGQRDGMY